MPKETRSFREQTTKAAGFKLSATLVLVVFLAMIPMGSLHAQTGLSNNSTFEEQDSTLKIQQKKLKLKKMRNTSLQVEEADCLFSLEDFFNTKLAVCATGDDCREGLNVTKGPLHLPTAMHDRRFNFTWTSERAEMDGVLWQVASRPFGCNEIANPAGLVKQGSEMTFTEGWDGKVGYFSIDFSTLSAYHPLPLALRLKPETVGKKKLKARQTPQFQAAPEASTMPGFPDPSIYYIRIVPLLDGNPLFGSSNTIMLRFDDRPPASELEVILPPEKHFPDLYNVAVASFTPIRFPTLKWGSMWVVGFDEDLYQQARSNPLTRKKVKKERAKYNKLLKKHQPLTLAPYKGEGSEGWLDSLWDAVNSAADWVSESYSWAKEQIVEIAASLADALPLVDCDDDCKALLKTGLEVGMVAMGLPPSLPNAQQLLAEGTDYLAAEISSQIGCGDLCTDVIRDQLERLGEDLTKRNLSMVANEEEAHRNGCEPMSVPAWVKVRPAPEASIQPPKLVLELSRNQMNITGDPLVDLDSYYLRIGFSCKNGAYKKGDKLRVPVNTIYKDGLAVGYDTEKLKLTQRPVASLWASKLIPIPPIKTGTTLTIPIIPSEAGYLFPGHLDLIRARGGHIFDDDWSQMYMDGDLTITVEIVGKDIEAISWNEVFHTIDGVEMKTTLPNQYDGGYLKRRRIQ